MKKLLLFFIICILSYSSFAQKKALFDVQSPFVLGQVHKIKSNALGETRTLNIYLPERYSNDSATTYPVIYLLDGSADEDFVHIVGLVQFLTMIEAMPKSIVVGIANVDRKRDFTFPTTIAKDKHDYPTTGSSAKFISFIGEDLQPFIQRTFKTNGLKTIIGQSLGGLLATEMLLKTPGLFDNYLIVSPSLWWDNESLLTAAPKLLAQQNDRKMHVFIAVGAEGETMENDAKKLNEIMQQSERKNLRLTLLSLPKENHLTILHNAIYQGLEWLYAK